MSTRRVGYTDAMAIAITLEDITPYVTMPSDDASKAKANAWLASINAGLNARYPGVTLTSAIAPAIFDIVGQAITERFNKLSGASPDPRIKSQSIAGASIEYFAGAASGYFTLDQLGSLDDLLGGGNTRSVRTPAPDPIRYGNLMPADWHQATINGQPIESVI